MSRDDIPEPDADGAQHAGAAAGDDALDAPLRAAAEAFRGLREPLEPAPALDARIRAAAVAGARHPGGAKLTRAPTPAGASVGAGKTASAGRAGTGGRYAAWGLAMAAGIALCVVLVRPSMPFLPAPAGDVASTAHEAASPAEALGADPGPDAARAGEFVAPRPAFDAAGAAAARSAPMGPATARAVAVESAANRPVVSDAVDAPPPAADAGAALAEGALADALPTGSEPSLPTTGTSLTGTAPARAPATLAAPASKLASAVRATAGDKAPSAVAEVATAALPSAPPTPGVQRELQQLRALQRAGDPRLPARLREFVERHPAHPLALTDPELAALLPR